MATLTAREPPKPAPALRTIPQQLSPAPATSHRCQEKLLLQHPLKARAKTPSPPDVGFSILKERLGLSQARHVISESNAQPRTCCAPPPEKESAMTILARLELWKEQGAISTEQQAHLASLARGEPFSLSLELQPSTSVCRRVVAFVCPDSCWTISTWSRSNSVMSSS